MTGTMLITGGSRGIGAATAVLAAEAGYDICLNFVRNRAAAQDVATQCEAHGASVLIAEADVSAEADVVAMFRQCDAELGPPTVLVNNAGVLGDLLPLVEFTVERMQRTIDVNVVGALLCAREAARRMSTERGGTGGSIINVSSRASTLGSPNEYVDYAASKGAVDTMTIGLSKELAPGGIRVNAVRPGLIETDIQAPGRIERLRGGIPQGRPGRVDEVARLILWLASEEASYVNGALVDVSGAR